MKRPRLQGEPFSCVEFMMFCGLQGLLQDRPQKEGVKKKGSPTKAEADEDQGQIHAPGDRAK